MVAEAWFQDHICPKWNSEIPVRNSLFTCPSYQKSGLGIMSGTAWEAQGNKQKKKKANLKASFNESTL